MIRTRPNKKLTIRRIGADEVPAGALADIVSVGGAVGAAVGELTAIQRVARPGWCKLDWVIADPTRGKLAKASNVLDPTWEAPDGTIVPFAQCDGLIMSAIQAPDGPQESRMVGHLLSLRNSLQARETHAQRTDEMSGIQDAALAAVNDYFERALRSVPEIETYLGRIAARAP